MKAEIIAVGTELLLGQVVNTNATFLSEQLADLGIEVYYQTVVGDNQQRLEELIALAETRSELILLCGGLGPTEDDLTKEATAAHLGKSLIQNTEGYKNYWHILKQPIENDQKQSATVPDYRRRGSSTKSYRACFRDFLSNRYTCVYPSSRSA